MSMLGHFFFAIEPYETVHMTNKLDEDLMYLKRAVGVPDFPWLFYLYIRITISRALVEVGISPYNGRFLYCGSSAKIDENLSTECLHASCGTCSTGPRM